MKIFLGKEDGISISNDYTCAEHAGLEEPRQQEEDADDDGLKLG